MYERSVRLAVSFSELQLKAGDAVVIVSRNIPLLMPVSVALQYLGVVITYLDESTVIQNGKCGFWWSIVKIHIAQSCTILSLRLWKTVTHFITRSVHNNCFVVLLRLRHTSLRYIQPHLNMKQHYTYAVIYKRDKTENLKNTKQLLNYVWYQYYLW